MTLADLLPGQEAEVVSLTLPADEVRMMRAMGLAPGSRVSVGHRAAFGGPLEVVVGDGVLAVGRDLACAVLVRVQ